MQEFLQAVFLIYQEIAPYLFIGLTFAGLMHIFLGGSFIYRHLGKKNLWSILKASLFGVPLPLCSCGVIPTAMHLRRKGASQGATISFLTSTPQTGIDSIIPTIGMLGWFMGIYRPVTALLMGVLAGTSVNFLPNKENTTYIESCASGSCLKCECNDPDCPHPSHPWNRDKKVPEHNHEHSAETKSKWKNFINYSYRDFLDDISTQLTVGIILAGLITWLIPEDFFLKYGGEGIAGMLFMIAIGLPMYVCATGSIPIAVSLMMKGISPGAAFVFLVVGPATNAASITVIASSLGKKVTAVYLSVLTLSALLFGFLLNYMKPDLAAEISMLHKHHAAGSRILLDIITVLFTFILLMSLWRKYAPTKKLKSKEEGTEMRKFIVDMHCNHCVKAVRKALEEMTAVKEIEINLADKLVKLKGDFDDEQVISKIKELGYDIRRKEEDK